jgi:hypothetical protein
MRDATLFDRDTLEQAFLDLGRQARLDGRVVEIAIYGGSALMLTMPWRIATRDVDAVFERDKGWVRKAAAALAADRGWPVDWLNDGVKGFLSRVDEDPGIKSLFRTYPSEAEPGLRVFVPRPEYLFAMKCRAMRVGGVEGSQDIEDIRRLALEIGLQSAAEALELLSGFYPDHLIEPKTRFGLEEIFDLWAGKSEGGS